MTWVHLATYPIGIYAALALWIGEYTRFAAGAFVLIAGMTVARIFGPKLSGPPGVRVAARRYLVRRALTLAVLDRLVGVTFAAVERVLTVHPAVHPTYPDLLDIVLFVEPGVTGGLLLLYSALLLVTPLVDALRARLGSGAVLAVSLAVYCLGHLSGLWSPPVVWPFPVAYWQLLFVAGYLVADRLDALRDSEGRISLWWLGLVSAGFSALFLARNGLPLGLGVPPELAGAFVKVPLYPAEVAWYLTGTAFVLTWMAWAWERSPWLRRRLGWLCLLGRMSLLVYVSHLFIELPILELLTRIDPTPLGRTLVLPLSVAVLVGIAVLGERLKRVRVSGTTPIRSVWPREGLVGGMVAVGALVAVLGVQRVIDPPAHWSLAAMDTQYRAELTADGNEIMVGTPEDRSYPYDLEPAPDPWAEGDADLLAPMDHGEGAQAASET